MVKEAKLIKIGNSQGLRLPKGLISKYGLGDQVVLEECPEGILIHATQQQKLSWEDTYKAMVQEEKGEWTDWNSLDIEEDKHL